MQAAQPVLSQNDRAALRIGLELPMVCNVVGLCDTVRIGVDEQTEIIRITFRGSFGWLTQLVARWAQGRARSFGPGVDGFIAEVSSTVDGNCESHQHTFSVRLKSG